MNNNLADYIYEAYNQTKNRHFGNKDMAIWTIQQYLKTIYNINMDTQSIYEWYENLFEKNKEFKKQLKPVKYYPIYSKHYPSLQLDLSFWTYEGSYIIPIFTSIEITSRYVFAKVLQTKHQTQILAAMNELIQDYQNRGLRIVAITTDLGSEFKGNNLKNFCDANAIVLYNSDKRDHHKLGKIEKFHRTLKERLLKYRVMYYKNNEYQF